MNPAIERMLSRYDLSKPSASHRALREILQEICLLGIWRAKLFEKMAFYGGTALRILYGLDRFSEDMDFTLLEPDSSFSWDPFQKTIISELEAYGFEVSFDEKQKSLSSPVKSAFLKTNTLSSYLHVNLPDTLMQNIHPSANLKIKVEVDTDPTLGFTTCTELIREPLPVSIVTITKPDLFASKLHAALFRAWKNRVKGRDWYDVVWYIRNNIPLSLSYFKENLKKNETYLAPDDLTGEDVKAMAMERLDAVDVEGAITDMANFINEPDFLSTWDCNFLKLWIEKMQFT